MIFFAQVAAQKVGESGGSQKIVEALLLLFKGLNELFGPLGAIFIPFALFACWMGYNIYQDKKKEAATEKALSVMEESIQRLATDVRHYRMKWMVKIDKLSIEDAERLLIVGGKTPAETRDKLEGNSSED